STASQARARNVRRSRYLGRSSARADDIGAYTAELATMLRAGLSLDRALRLLGSRVAHPQIAQVNQQLLEDIKAGHPFSRALARHPKIFDDFFVNLVRAGEASGHLGDALVRVQEHQERVRALRAQAVAAATYPAILLLVSLLSVLVMLLYVVPQFREVFSELGDRLPLATRLMMGLSAALTENATTWVAVVVVAVAATLAALRSDSGRAAWRRMQYRLPLIGPLRSRYQQAVFARTLGTLLDSGVNLVAALGIAADAFGHPADRGAIAAVTAEIKSGRRMADVLQEAALFDPLVTNLVRVGEETGRLGPMWQEVARILEREVQARMQRWLTVLEPVLILVLGALIAGIIVSILLGILAVNDLAI
ncbi:MAG: type II secretion system F family protein, partial [Tepidimonas taiwanensis]|nr:type II secretion system F family protein [Tepidimonas taiwanensis]